MLVELSHITSLHGFNIYSAAKIQNHLITDTLDEPYKVFQDCLLV